MERETGLRTRYLNLGKVALYLVSYSRSWGRPGGVRWGSVPRTRC